MGLISWGSPSSDPAQETWWDYLLKNWRVNDFVQADDAMRTWLQVRREVVRKIHAQSIVEIGVGSGYAAYAMMSAVPRAHYWGYDTWDVDPAGKTHAGYLLTGYKVVELRNILGEEGNRLWPPPPRCDLVHLQGIYGETELRHLLYLALGAGRRVLVAGAHETREARLVLSSILTEYGSCLRVTGLRDSPQSALIEIQ